MLGPRLHYPEAFVGLGDMSRGSLMLKCAAERRELAYVKPETIAMERREQPVNVFQFGNQTVKTKVFMMTPPEVNVVSIDVVDYMWEKRA